MNILRRLTKIEEQLKVNNAGSGFCDCYRKYISSVIDRVYNRKSDIETESCPMPDLEKPVCDICKKRISEADVEMERKICLFYGDKTN
jgi:hypothetical protein